MPRKSDDSFPEQDVERRTKAIMTGAFAGSPTPLKDIPKRDGKARLLGKAQRRKRRRQRKNRAA